MSSTGKTAAARIPRLISPSHRSETAPTREGPAEQPRSPASASMANIAVPPPRRDAEALLNVPGQRMPTEMPLRAHPKRLSSGDGAALIKRYARMQKELLKIINLPRFIFSPYFP